jgi:L-2-hydroxyglutarate oxidase LhgO
VTEDVECVVVGAGVIGLAVARALALEGREVLLLEAEDAFGTGTSARNSEVIHAGIYYPAGSLKAQLCVRGKAMLYDYCAARGVAHRRTGKLIVATNADQIGTLKTYAAQGKTNGVDDLEIIGGDGLRAREPHVEGIAAVWSPSTGIVDSHGLMLALLGDFENAGGTLAFQSPVDGYKSLNECHEVTVGATVLKAPVLINAAGHGAPPLAGKGAPGQYFAAGHYFTYTGKAPFSHLVYPVAEAGGLGVHATLDLGGQIKFGPDVEWRGGLDYEFDRSRQAEFEARIRTYFPGLESERLQPGYVGIRPKISGPGEAAADFVIAGPQAHGIRGLVHLFGIESPGLTSALALADEVVRRLG